MPAFNAVILLIALVLSGCVSERRLAASDASWRAFKAHRACLQDAQQAGMNVLDAWQQCAETAKALERAEIREQAVREVEGSGGLGLGVGGAAVSCMGGVGLGGTILFTCF